jgi:hypothetical protein
VSKFTVCALETCQLFFLHRLTDLGAASWELGDVQACLECADPCQRYAANAVERVSREIRAMMEAGLVIGGIDVKLLRATQQEEREKAMTTFAEKWSRFSEALRYLRLGPIRRTALAVWSRQGPSKHFASSTIWMSTRQRRRMRRYLEGKRAAPSNHCWN